MLQPTNDIVTELTAVFVCVCGGGSILIRSSKPDMTYFLTQNFKCPPSNRLVAPLNMVHFMAKSPKISTSCVHFNPLTIHPEV